MEDSQAQSIEAPVIEDRSGVALEIDADPTLGYASIRTPFRSSVRCG
jgi:hypothetical protein